MIRAPRVLVLAAVTGFVSIFAAIPAMAQDVPYTDPAAVGTITFCDAHGHQIDGGTLGPIPFVAKAIGSAPLSAPYDSPGSAAYLDAYQPREGVTPPEWSGEELISGSFFKTSGRPAVVGTKGDISMRQFVQDAPPQWDGFVELRLFVRGPNGEFDPLHYSASDIQVSGDSWHVVRGGDLPCNSGTARSIASLLAPSAASGKLNSGDNPPPERSSGSPGASDAPSTGSDDPNTSPDPGETSSDTAVVGSSNAATADDGSVPVGYIVLATLVVVLAAALAFAKRREIQSLFAQLRGGSG